MYIFERILLLFYCIIYYKTARGQCGKVESHALEEGNKLSRGTHKGGDIKY